MTTTALKAMIEPTQEGATFETAWRASDWLMLHIESAINGAEDISELSEKLDYAVTMLQRASNAIDGLDLDEKIEE